MKQVFTSIQKAQSSSFFRHRDNQKTGLRLLGSFILLLSVCIILIIRLFQLTIVKGHYYRNLSEDNRLISRVVLAKRGALLDRRGNPLAESVPSEYIAYPYLAGQNIVSQWKRTYTYSSLFAHSIGYVRIPSREDISGDTCKNPIEKNNLVGSLGLEKLYECQLRGKSGLLLVEKDTMGKPIKTLSYRTPVKGNDIHTSLDANLQQQAYKVFPQNARGAVIMTKPKTGEILVYASFPSFNPNLFVDSINNADINELFNDTKKPIFDRIAQGTYPPGSVFKLAVLSGALHDNTIPFSFTVEDTGQIQAGPSTFGNWYYLQYGKTEGTVNAIKALQRSNDIFFYRVGEKMGPENIKKWAKLFGYGTSIPFPFPHNEGLVPNEFWKKEELGENWYLGDTYNMSIGQGYILVTPLQVHHATSIIANNGWDCPMIFEKKQAAYQPRCSNINLRSDVLKIIHEGMKRACETGGTGWPFFDFKIFSSSESAKLGLKPKSISVLCKTGTAESHLPSKKPHAWFTAYAPEENPEIAITVLVEESGEGSSVAAPIAKDLVKAYFEKVE